MSSGRRASIATSLSIRVRIAYCVGTDARQFIEAAIGTCGTTSGTEALTYLAAQTNDTVYNANAIDGSTVTGITISDGIDRMLINIAGGSVSWSQVYAYNVYWLSTTAGIRDDGAIMTATDTANYLVSGFQIRNTSTVPLSITGGYHRLFAHRTYGCAWPLRLFYLLFGAASALQESIARGLKRLAKELNCVVMVLSQLSREADKTDGPPRLDHLSESGGIEQAADIIGLLWREARRKPKPDNKHTAQIEFAKNKNGPTDTVHLWFDGATQRFEDAQHGGDYGR